MKQLILLDKKIILKNVAETDIFLDIFTTLPSTNDYLKSNYPNKNTRICLSEQQTQGRGRLQRNWHSPFAQNIYFSCLYSFQKNINELAGLSLVVSLAIIKTLQVFVPDSLLVKWPNDVLCEDKKISGNLIEVQAQTNHTCDVIIGIGINVNMLEDDNQINQAWTSLQKLTGHSIDRNQVVAVLINTLIQYLKKFSQLGLIAFLDEWQTHDYLFDKQIVLNNLNNKIAGTAKGINLHGHLLLEERDGCLRPYSSGDTTISK